LCMSDRSVHLLLADMLESVELIGTYV